MAGFRGHFSPGARQGALQFLAGNEVWYFGDQFVASQGTEIQKKKKKNKQTNNLKHLIHYFLRVQAGAMQFPSRLPNFISAGASLLHQCIRSFWKSSLFTCTTQIIICCTGASLLHQCTHSFWKTSLFTCTTQIIICCTGASLLHQCTHSFGRLHSSHAQQRSLSAVQWPANSPAISRLQAPHQPLTFWG